MSEEKTAQAYLLREVNKVPGCIALNTQASEYTHRGLPDVVACIRGEFRSYEVKDKGKKATVIQAFVGEKIQEAGGSWTVVQGLEQARRVVRELRDEEDSHNLHS